MTGSRRERRTSGGAGCGALSSRVLALLVVGALVWIVMFSSVLAVRRVAVDGETTLSESQVRQAADVRIGQPLARIDVSAIEARVASMERIQSVTVSRSWLHTVRITVVERTPVAWLTVGGVIRGLDRYGIDFRTYDKAPKGLLEAEVTATDPRRRQQTLEAVAAVVQLIEDDDRALRKQVQAVSAATKDSIELNLTKGRTVVWGSRADSSAQADRAARPPADQREALRRQRAGPAHDDRARRGVSSRRAGSARVPFHMSHRLT